MKDHMTRREAIKTVAAGGALTATATAAQAIQPPAKRGQHNQEPVVESQAAAEHCGPRELFAVVDEAGNLKRGLHAASARSLGLGIYQVTFKRDVRRGAYFVTPGGHGYSGVPVAAVASVVGRATDPRAVLVYIADMEGDPIAAGFHLLVVCPEGFAGP
jgi:hypothetical protein